MRTILVSLLAVLCIGLATAAQAERRMFIIANDAGGYGVDRCLASGRKVRRGGGKLLLQVAKLCRSGDL